MNQLVPEDTWNLNQLEDLERKRRLLHPPSPAELLRALVRDATRAAAQGEILLRWCRSRDFPGCSRVVAKIPITSVLFDQLFNGRSGYRAQYYLSVEDGRRYNRALVDGLAPAIQLTHAGLTGFEAAWSLVEQSLHGVSSKIWMPQDEAVLKAASAALRPTRWAEFWRNSEAAWGLRLPLPPDPQMI